MNRPVLLIAFILIVLAAVFYFGSIATGAVTPLLILGVVALVFAIFSGK
jgi:hypothetical protein